jgi:hypothetical protein
MQIETRKRIIIISALFLLAIMAVGSAASFVVLERGFSDMPRPLQLSLAGFGFVIMQAAYVWLVFGYTRAFESGPTRFACLLGLSGLTVAEAANLITSFMLIVGLPLEPILRDIWIPWSGVFVFGGILVTVLLVVVADTAVSAAKATGRAVRRAGAYARR